MSDYEPNYYPENSVGRYLRDHDFAMLQIKSLFMITSEGDVDFIDPNAGFEQAEVIIQGMANYPDKFIKNSAEILSLKAMLGASQSWDACFQVESEADERMTFGQLQADFGAAEQRRNYWLEAANDVDAILQEMKSAFKPKLLALNAA